MAWQRVRSRASEVVLKTASSCRRSCSLKVILIIVASSRAQWPGRYQSESDKAIRALYSHPAGVGRVGAARQPLAPWRHYYPVLLRAASRGEDVTALGQAFERLRVVRTALIFVHDRRR
jgi:hypothetical protein